MALKMVASRLVIIFYLKIKKFRHPETLAQSNLLAILEHHSFDKLLIMAAALELDWCPESSW